jgi:hypothetical protein
MTCIFLSADCRCRIVVVGGLSVGGLSEYDTNLISNTFTDEENKCSSTYYNGSRKGLLTAIPLYILLQI